MDELRRLLDEVIRERDELIDRLESCRMALDDMTEHAEEFKAEVRRMKEERDEARKCAEEMRDLYAAEVDESKKAFPWPWEAQNERG